MNKPDWFKFYPEKWLASKTVRRMSLPARAVYFDLLCEAWHQTPPGTLPDDDGAIADLAGVKPSVWAKVAPEVRKAFVRGDNGRLYQPFMSGPIADAAYTKITQAQAAAKKRWGDASASKPDADALRTHSERNASQNGSQCHQDPDPEQMRLDQTQMGQTTPVPVSDITAVERAVGTLRVSALVRGRVGKLGGLTVKEIADTFEAVKRDALDPDTQPPIRDVDATVAHRLLAARGEVMPTKKAGNLSGSLSGALNANGLEGLMNIRRSRMGRTA